jgi:hypothetical protein
VAAKKALAGISTETTAQADGSQTQSEIRRLSTKEWGPADRFTTYEHGAFLVDYPADWPGDGRSKHSSYDLSEGSHFGRNRRLRDDPERIHARAGRK